MAIYKGTQPRILAGLKRAYPQVKVALTHRDPYELLVATILSAQCTDVRVNLVTPALFRRFPDPKTLAKAEPIELEALIRSTGFFRNKAKNLIGMARKVMADFQGQVPRTMEALLTLPGVARKTANVVLGSAFHVAVGIVVDTHVMRLSQRLGLTRETRPEKIEPDLMAIVPPEEWIQFSLRLIQHGREVCLARHPHCPDCPIRPDCPSAKLFLPPKRRSA